RATTMSVVKPARKPSVIRAGAVESPPLETTTADMTAAPNAPPIWNAALAAPEATPAIFGSTVDSVAATAAVGPAPGPRPKINRPGNRSERYVLWTETCDSRNTATTIRTAATAATGPNPTFITTA